MSVFSETGRLGSGGFCHPVVFKVATILTVVAGAFSLVRQFGVD
jgi:hypothetical protein